METLLSHMLEECKWLKQMIANNEYRGDTFEALQAIEYIRSYIRLMLAKNTTEYDEWIGKI